MNLRDLKYIIAVADTRHFGRAAARCFVSQPTLRGQIKKVEDKLSVAIFERNNRAVEVTPVGKAILELARQVMEQADAIIQLARVQQDPLAGPLRVGVIPTLSPYLMPLILKPLRKQYPQMKLVLTEELTSMLLERLREHEIDAALLATQVEDSSLATMPLFDEPFWIAYPRHHPLQEKEKITRRDLEGIDLLLLAEGHCLASQAMDLCRLERDEHSDMADLRAASLETLLQLGGAGFGCTVVPALAMRGAWAADTGIIATKLELPDAHRRVSLVFRQSFPRRDAVEAFAAVIVEHLPKTVQAAAKSGARRTRKYARRKCSPDRVTAPATPRRRARRGLSAEKRRIPSRPPVSAIWGRGKCVA